MSVSKKQINPRCSTHCKSLAYIFCSFWSHSQGIVAYFKPLDVYLVCSQINIVEGVLLYINPNAFIPFIVEMVISVSVYVGRVNI